MMLSCFSDFTLINSEAASGEVLNMGDFFANISSTSGLFVGVSGNNVELQTANDFKEVKTSYVGSLRHSKTRSDLMADSKYYIRVCAYKKIEKTTYQGAYSNIKTSFASPNVK